MFNHWTFSRRIAAGFVAVVGLTIVLGIVAILALNKIVHTKDVVIEVYGDNIKDAQELALATAREAIQARGYLLDARPDRIGGIANLRKDIDSISARLRQRATSPEIRTLLDRIDESEAAYSQKTDQLIGMRSKGVKMEQIIAIFEDELAPQQRKITETIDLFLERQYHSREEAKLSADATVKQAITYMAAIGIFIVIVAVLVAFVLSRGLARQIGSAISQMQSSSAELQAAANQQATGAKEQATAMSQVATTMSELLVTSRQIAESAQSVARVSDQTTGMARTGDGAVIKSNDSVNAMKRQVDLIVNHMLDLGKKSQQIGSVLDIVAELAEQTNILAINATIEAAGAGESGKRFAVVADEIRKLADRVTGSTKEIRSLIDEVRSAVNTTVMTTEAGSKSVEAGTRNFAEVASFFKQIAEMVLTTTQAAREIELSTKQQTTAVEQVNLAISNVAQATRENEASSSQTLQTAGQMVGLSRELLRLVRTEAA